MNSIHYVKWEGKKGQAGLQGNACSKWDVGGLRRWRSLMSPRGAAWPKARVIESLGMAFGVGKVLLSPVRAEMGKTLRLAVSWKALGFEVPLCYFLVV